MAQDCHEFAPALSDKILGAFEDCEYFIENNDNIEQLTQRQTWVNNFKVFNNIVNQFVINAKGVEEN